MDQAGFAHLLNEFTLSAESGDGAGFASHFTEDTIYYDYIYGAHTRRNRTYDGASVSSRRGR